MEDKAATHVVVAFAVVCVAGPLILMLWQPALGLLLLPMGLLVAARSWYVHQRVVDAEGRRRHSRAHVKANQANIIYVQVVDDQGNDLPPAVARAKLEAAQMEAGPRDTVLPVRRKL